jgi:competence protein ComEA
MVGGMSEARPRFRRRLAPPEIQGRVAAMVLLLLLSGGLLLARQRWLQARAEAPFVMVEVGGAVPSPGVLALPVPATVHAAIRQAGGDPTGMVDTSVPPGTRIVVEAGGWRAEPMDELLVVGLPVDVNAASAAALEAIPGLGPSVSAAIVADREANGRFSSVEELDRVKGVGPSTVERMRPFVVVGP